MESTKPSLFEEGEISLDTFATFFDDEKKVEVSLEEELGLEKKTEEEEEEVITGPVTDKLTNGATDEIKNTNNTNDIVEVNSSTEPIIESSNSPDSQPAVLEEGENKIFSIVKNMLEVGAIEDLSLIVDPDSEETTLLSEYADITAEELTEIIEADKQQRKTQVKEKYISREGLDETSLKIVDILKNGGSLEDLVNPEKGVNVLKKPFEGYDLDDDLVRKKVFVHYYMQKGIKQSDAKGMLDARVKEGVFEDEVDGIIDLYNKSYEKGVADMQTKFKNEAAEERNRIKETKKNITTTLKEKGFKDNVVRKVVDGITKYDSEGFLPIERKIDLILKNPETHYKVLLHLLDDKSFETLIKENTSTGASKATIKLVRDVKKQSNKIKGSDSVDTTVDSFERELQEEVNRTIKLRGNR